MNLSKARLTSGRGLSLALSLIIAAVISSILIFAFVKPWRVRGQGGNPVTTVSAASFAPVVAPDSIAAAFGTRLATQNKSADSQPLPTDLAGTTVRVNGELAPLFFVSSDQVNYLIPPGTPTGTATVVVTASDGAVSTGTAQVSNVAPGVFTANANGRGVPAATLLRAPANGPQHFEAVAQFNPSTRTFAPKPILFGAASERLFLILYLTGVRRAGAGAVRVVIGGVEIAPAFAGPAPGFTGLDQINLELLPGLSVRGPVKLQVKAGNAMSNETDLEIGAATTTALTSSPNPSVAGQPVSFTAKVSAVPPNAGTPAGSVLFTDNGVMIGNAPLDTTGQVSINVPLTAAGPHAIAATYNGSVNFKESSAALPGGQTVNKAQSVITVTASANPAVRDQAVTLTAAVRSNPQSSIAPAGVVQFKDNTANLGAPVTLIEGSANFSTTALALGAHSITAEYYGDPNLQGGVSSGLSLQVNPSELRVGPIVRPPVVYAGDEITIEGSGFSSDPAAQEVLVIDDDDKETRAQVIAAEADQLRVRLPFGAGSGRVKVKLRDRESESPDKLALATSISGFVQEAVRQPDGSFKRQPIPGLKLQAAVINMRVPAETNADGSFVVKFPASASIGRRVDLYLNVDGKLPFPNDTRSLGNVRSDRDNQYSGDTVDNVLLANTIELKRNSDAKTNTLAAGLPVNETVSVAAPASPDEALGSITSGQITFDTNNSVITYPGGGTSGSLTLTALDAGRTPANLPIGYFSSAIAQITPFGATLTPGGKLIFPNSDGIPVGTPVRVFRFDQTPNSPTLGSFVDIGAATITADGARIETAANAVTQTSYYFVSRQWPKATISGFVVDADGRPVRRAVIGVRGQSTFTGNNGGFVLDNVPVITPDGANDPVTIEISFVRPDGSVARAQRGVILKANDRITLDQDIALPRQTTNRRPQIIAPSSLVLTEGETRDFDLIVIDPDGQPLTVTPSGVSFSSVSAQGNGVYRLRLSPGAAGTYPLLLTATDSMGLASKQNLTVIVQRADSNAPAARYQTVTTDEDTAVGITLSAGNPGGSQLSYTLLSNPAHGRLSGVAPNLIYTPAANYNGADSFSFKVTSSGRESNVATVFIAINPVNDAPVLSISGETTVGAGQTVTLNLTATDADVRQVMSFASQSLPPGASLIIDSENRARFVWTPVFTQAGAYAVDFAVTDNGLPERSATASVTIKVEARWAKTSGPEGGGTRAIIALGSTVILSTDFNGIYRSTNSGQSWNEANVGLTEPGSKTASSFAVIGTTIFAGTEAGVYRSADNGQSWIPVGPDGNAVRLAVIGATLFASSHGRIFRSNDGGRNWAQTNFPPQWVTALTANDTSLYVGTERNGIYRSNDNGNSWIQLNNGLPADVVDGQTLYRGVASIAINGATLWAGIGGAHGNIATDRDSRLYRSQNSGQSWQPVKYGHVESILFRGNTIFIGGGAYDREATFLSYSTDGGQTWQYAINNREIHALTANETTIFAATWLFGVHRSTDNGANWGESNVGLINSNINALAVLDDHLFVGSSVQAYLSKNRGQSFTHIFADSARPNSYHGGEGVSALATLGKKVFLGRWGGVWRSIDYGLSWENVTSQENDETNLYGLQAVEMVVNGRDILLGAADRGFALSTDEGETWQFKNNGLPTFVEGAETGIRGVWSLAIDGNTYFAGVWDNGVYRSTNKGETWAPANQGLPPNMTVWALAASGTTLYAGVGDRGIYVSNDRGNTWAEANSGLRPLRVYKFAIIGSMVLAGTQDGVFLTDNNGMSWRQINIGIPDGVPVTTFILSGPNLYAGTLGYGVILLTNNVQSWIESNTNLTNRFINAIAVKNNLYFAGTLDGGVYRSTKEDQRWAAVNNGLPSSTNVQAFAASNSSLFAGTFDRGVYRSSNDGDSWTELNANLPSNPADPLRNPRNVNALRLNGNVLLAATDGGVFRLVNPDSNGSWAPMNLNERVLALGSKGTMLFAGTYGRGIYRSSDGGQNWQSFSSGLGNLSVSAFGLSGDGKTLFAGTDNGVYRLTESSSTWIAVNAGLPPKLPIFAIVAAGEKLYAASLYGVFLSTDNGASWKQINAGLLNIHVTAMTLDGNRLIAGTKRGGVFISQVPGLMVPLASSINDTSAEQSGVPPTRH